MSYANPFLADFSPIFHAILKEKNMDLGKMELIIIDEEPDGHHVFEPADVKDVLEQLRDDINALTIYTDREIYFKEFVEMAYEENGLLALVFSKKELCRREIMCTKSTSALVLDFEWEGTYFHMWNNRKYAYIPIHKKPWKMGKNLDILVPFGYNTVIVKRMQMTKKVFGRDRFEAGFYRDESFF